MEIEENGEEFICPAWINSEFLREILSADLKKDVSVTNFDVERAVPKGENYLSILYRVVIEYKENKDASETEKYFLIIKILPKEEFIQKILTEVKGFQKEAYMYTDVLPAMYRLLKSRKGEINLFAAKRLPCSRENVIVMEDMKHLGYKMAKRKEGLDLDHCKIAVRTLARFHAASVGIFKINPSIMDMYEEGLFKEYEDEEKREERRKRAKRNVSCLASVVDTWPGYEKYGDRLRKLIPTWRDRTIEVVKPKKDSFNVLNHGDFWVNNMLFKYSPETGKVEDIKFVDFQISRFSSPALDLQYFLCSSPNNEVRFQHRHTLLEEYYNELADYCKALDLETELVTFEQFMEEFEEKNFFGLMTACHLLCLVLAEDDEVPETKELKGEDADDSEPTLIKKAVWGKKFRGIFQKLLVFYDEKGLL